jgi:hypothetical protein
MHRDETHVEQVTFPEKFFKNIFIIRPDAAMEKYIGEMSECMLSSKIIPNTASTVLDEE